MFIILEHLKNRYLSQKAQGMVEYALILALVVAVGIAVIGSDEKGKLGGAISDVFEKVAEQIKTIPPSGES